MRGPMILLAVLGALSFGGLYALGPMECGPRRTAEASDLIREASERVAVDRTSVPAAPAAPAAETESRALARAPEGASLTAMGGAPASTR